MKVWFVVLADGTRTAWNGERTDMDRIPPCVICKADPEIQPDCAECRGTGLILHIPFCPRPWDEAMPGLWIGGHDCQPSAENMHGECIVTDEFDLVFSLYMRPGYGPSHPIPNTYFRMADADLDPDHHTHIDDMAERVANAVADGLKVLVRCQAGMNRSGLVTVLAMHRLGWKVDDAIDRLREVRSPYVLFNQHFVRYLQLQEEHQHD